MPVLLPVTTAIFIRPLYRTSPSAGSGRTCGSLPSVAIEGDTYPARLAVERDRLRSLVSRQQVSRVWRAESRHQVVAGTGRVVAVRSARDVVERRRAAQRIQPRARISESTPRFLLIELGEQSRPLRCGTGGSADDVPTAAFDDVIPGRRI